MPKSTETINSDLLHWREALIPTLVHAKAFEERDSRGAQEMGRPELEPEWTEIVRFSDCDPLGHLNNAKYLEYFVHARDMHLKNAYQVDLTDHALKYQETWVVNEHQIAYLRPVRAKEKIRIRSRLLDYTDSTTFVESFILDQSGKKLKSFLWSKFTYIHLKSGRTATHPEFIRSILKETKIGGVGQTPSHFDTRLSQVRSEFR